MKKLIPFIILIAFIFSLNACKKSTDQFKTATINDYSPLEPGKYITYSLDSLVYPPFSNTAVTHTWQVKYVVDAAITDNLGRPAFRIIRYIRALATDAWQPENTFEAINTGNSLEFVENNQRFIKLRLAIQNDNSWKGNSYIDTYSQNSNVRYLDDWDYVYANVNEAATIGSFDLDSILIVNQRDEVIGNPADINSYSEINFGQEKYAAGIGLVYRKFSHSEWQPPTPGLGGYFVTGSYGVTYTMIDHN